MATRDGKGADLRRSLTLLWEGGTRGQRGPRPRLTVEAIAQAAVRIADADGLEALSMQRIAAELGYSAMSLYNHVPNKDLLLEVVADVAAGRPPELAGTGNFRDEVRSWAAALWARFQARPWLLRVPIDHAPVGPNQLAWLDRLLRPLLAAGLVGGEARAAALHLTAVVRGAAQISADMTGARGTGDGFPRGGAELARALSEVVDPRGYPALAAVHAAEIAGDGVGGRRPDDVLPAELGFGVDRFLDGVESWTARTRRDG